MFVALIYESDLVGQTDDSTSHQRLLTGGLKQLHVADLARMNGYDDYDSSIRNDVCYSPKKPNTTLASLL